MPRVPIVLAGWLPLAQAALAHPLRVESSCGGGAMRGGWKGGDELLLHFSTLYIIWGGIVLLFVEVDGVIQLGVKN